MEKRAILRRWRQERGLSLSLSFDKPRCLACQKCDKCVHSLRRRREGKKASLARARTSFLVSAVASELSHFRPLSDSFHPFLGKGLFEREEGREREKSPAWRAQIVVVSVCRPFPPPPKSARIFQPVSPFLRIGIEKSPLQKDSKSVKSSFAGTNPSALIRVPTHLVAPRA